MRITFVLPQLNLSGGVRVVAIYAERLQRRGHQVCVVSLKRQRRTVRDAVRALIKERRWPFRSRQEAAYFDGTSVEQRFVRHEGPVIDADVPEADVIVATWWQTAGWVWNLSPSRGRKVHFMQHYEVWGGDIEQIDAVYRLPIPKIVLTGWMRDLLRDKFGQEPLAQIPNSVDTDLFNAPPRGKQPVSTVGTTYFSIGPKGTDVVLKAFALALRREPRLHLLSMGYEPPVPELPMPEGSEYFHQPPQAMLPRLYDRCDAWLFGARVEGFGLPILEAMACRTPVIGTPAGAAPELIGLGGGILIPNEDANAMAEAILKIAAMSDDDWRAMSDEALRTVTGYTWEDATDRFEAALKQVAA
jgi:glycosyltransferase involved in cell wall biosynthesis